ncbi:MAG TPA: DUF4468 domain-containing protein [Williamwhitmania sp.]|nr:DUF4468 domain-containing protein [Williamwhitmania sp.]
MKKLILFALAILIVTACFSQDKPKKKSFWTNTPPAESKTVPLDSIFPVINGRIDYTDVFTVPDTTINATYTKAKLWFVDNFNNAKSVIQVDDKDNGIIKGRGVLDYGANHYFYYTITVMFKPGRVKYEITDIVHSYDGYIPGYGYKKEDKPLETWATPTRKQSVVSVYRGINDKFINLCHSLKIALLKPPSDNW